jgi:DNA-binding NarL/FixJ family response regulator
MPFSVLLIDDHQLFRHGLEMLIQSEWKEAQVFHADAMEAVWHSDTPRPDVVLLDVKLQGLNGLESIKLLHLRWPGLPIIMISSDASSATVKHSLDKGAVGFVSKASNSETIFAALRAALNPHLTPDEKATEAARDLAPNSNPLTVRQVEVLTFINQGLTNKAIARKLFISENTVRGHVQLLLTALKATSRSEAVFNARNLGLID